ncbi:ribosome biogenesis GTPase YlqF [Aestuariicella hydrocarbonica]|uniref:Ribosome biogenesis GTPase A n=1 Tax=Pseudomaricurvus hydrocarbonicus TaxID=1470433 RepID=A0A9E5MPJ3_9GAMM|nr:ribosome biogenesis GTPase YlqF [Aestuariicella hydrocarbonica]NHO68020.1 ribosome biogenesis GTPase YlqF [Aestuariicella hydrocarbonica]
MAIQWYPGHMHKAQKEIKEVLPQVDLLIEVLDARIPFSSENPAIASLRGDKPCIKVLSKTDLADPEVTATWQAYLEQEKGVKTLAITTEQPGKMKLLLDLCQKMLPEKAAGVKTIHTMIVGIPNVGKSTLINTLAGKTIAKTGNEPAVTKSQQRINLGSGIMLLDTPGILWPKVENPKSSYRLAVTGAIKDTAMEYDDVGFFAADYLIKHYPDRLKERFQLDSIPNTELEFLEMAAARRGALSAGGRVNLHKICEVLIYELRSGALGRISLETPEMIEQEKQEVAAAQAAKEAEAEARKQRFKQGTRDPEGKNNTPPQPKQRRKRPPSAKAAGPKSGCQLNRSKGGKNTLGETPSAPKKPSRPSTKKRR